MNRKNKIILLIVCLLLCMAAAGGTFAWYLYGSTEAKRAQAQSAPVMAPYNLYLMNPNATDALEFAVGNLHPGEVKQVVICVSNKDPEGSGSAVAKDSEFGYDLMLAHTENLAVDYMIYPLEKISDPGKADITIMDDVTKELYYWTKNDTPIRGSDISDDMRERVFGNTNTDDIVNVGAYWRTEDDDMKLAYQESTGEYEYDYYLIEVQWQNISNFDAYKKETDLVYVVVNAKQPRPVE